MAARHRPTPRPDPGKVVVRDGWTIGDDTVTARYRQADPPPPPRDLEAELDALDARVDVLEGRQPTGGGR